MMEPSFLDVDSLIESIKLQLRDIARRELGGYISRLLADVNAFIIRAIDDIRIWATQLVAGEMTQVEFSFLIGGLQDRMALHALTEAGIGLITLQRIRNAVIDVILSSIFKIILP